MSRIARKPGPSTLAGGALQPQSLGDDGSEDTTLMPGRLPRTLDRQR